MHHGGGVDRVNKAFIERGYWYGWDEKNDDVKSSEPISTSVKKQRELFRMIEKGDRIAMKRKNIHTQTMKILGIGIVKAVDFEE